MKAGPPKAPPPEAPVVEVPQEPDYGPAPQVSDTPIQRILIVGISGYLGSSLALGLREDYEIYGTYTQRAVRMDGTTTFAMDAVNSSEIVDVIRTTQPDAIIYAAGISDPDAAQKDKDRTDTLHIKAPSLVLKTSIRPPHFIYFSTDQVFGDVPANIPIPLDDRAPTSPINTIGISKSQAEGMVMSNKRGSHVLRLGPLFGEPYGSSMGFRRSWIEALRRRMERKETLFLPRSQIRSHLYVGDFVRAVKAYLKKIPMDSCVYNVAPKNSLPLYDFSAQFARVMGYPEDAIRRSEKEDSLSNVQKSKNSSLNSARFEKHFDFQFQTIEDSLIEFAERLKMGHTKKWI